MPFWLKKRQNHFHHYNCPPAIILVIFFYFRRVAKLKLRNVHSGQLLSYVSNLTMFFLLLAEPAIVQFTEIGIYPEIYATSQLNKTAKRAPGSGNEWDSPNDFVKQEQNLDAWACYWNTAQRKQLIISPAERWAEETSFISDTNVIEAIIKSFTHHMKREDITLLMKINATISLVHIAFSAVRRVANTVWTVHLVEAPFAANTASSLLGHDAASLTRADLWIFFSEDPFKLCQVGWRLLVGSHFQDSLEPFGSGWRSQGIP